MIEGRNINLRYGAKTVLDDVSISLQSSELLIVCGPNGAGKSSLLSAMSGDIRKLRPCVEIDGQNLSKFNALEMAQKRAVLEQSPSLSANFTVQELIELSIPIAIKPSDTSTIIHNVLVDVGLLSLKSQTVQSLSGGQRHRAHVGRVLAQLLANQKLGQNGYLFLDEPTASLDIAHQMSVMKIAKSMVAKGAGVFVVLHDLNLAAAFADRIVLMKNGKIIRVGSVVDVFTEHRLRDVYETDVLVNANKAGGISIMPNYQAALANAKTCVLQTYPQTPHLTRVH